MAHLDDAGGMAGSATRAAWVAFAVARDCGWPKYEPPHRLTMRFDTVSIIVRDPLAAQLAVWSEVR